MWNYRAGLERVVDARTIDFNVDLGFGHYVSALRVTLAGIDVPDPTSEVAAEALEAGTALEYVEQWFDPKIPVGPYAFDAVPWPYLITTAKTEEFGVYCAAVYVIQPFTNLVDLRNNSTSLNQDMLAEGHARAYAPQS